MKIKNIGIIGGTGKQGEGLARHWIEQGLEVVIGSRSKERGEQKAKELSKKYNKNVLGGTNEFACTAEIIVLAIPSSEITTILEPLKEQLKGKIILDIMVNLKFGKFIKAEKIENKSIYEFMREFLPESDIVSCFKTISADLLLNEDSIDQSDFHITLSDKAWQVSEYLSRLIGLTPIRVRGKFHAFTIERMVALAIQLNKQYSGSHVGYIINKLNF